MTRIIVYMCTDLPPAYPCTPPAVSVSSVEWTRETAGRVTVDLNKLAVKHRYGSSVTNVWPSSQCCGAGAGFIGSPRIRILGAQTDPCKSLFLVI